MSKTEIKKSRFRLVKMDLEKTSSKTIRSFKDI